MNTPNNNANNSNNLYLRIAVILLALNFIVNGYFVYSVLKVGEMNQDSTITVNKITKK